MSDTPAPPAITTDDALRERAGIIGFLQMANQQMAEQANRLSYLNGVLEGRGVPLDTPVPEPVDEVAQAAIDRAARRREARAAKKKPADGALS